MKTESRAGFMEAARLTRAGRLAEATAFLQRMLQGKAGTQAADMTAEYEGTTIAGTAKRVAPEGNRAPSSPPPHSRPASVMPDALRSFLDGGLGDGLNALSGLSRPPSAEPVAVPQGARFLTATFSNAAGSRPYKLYVPGGYRGEPVPLIVMLHGCTQSPDDFAAGTRMNEAAEEHACLVVYPGQTSAANSSKCWNWFNAGDQQRDSGEPSLIAGITRQIMRDYAVDPRRVYIAGLSAGGAAAATMGAAYPDLYAAIGVHSGLACGSASDIPSAFAAMRQGTGGRGKRRRARDSRIVPTIVFHGDRDKTVHPSNGDNVIAQSIAGGPLDKRREEGRVPGGHSYSRTLHSEAKGATVLEQWVVHGAGHAWAGGSAAGSYTDPKGPDATGEMLRFFLEHPHPAKARA